MPSNSCMAGYGNKKESVELFVYRAEGSGKPVNK